MPREVEFLDAEEIELRDMQSVPEIREFLSIFNKPLKQIFEFVGSLHTQKNINYQFIFLQFSDIFEIIWRLRFFPNKIPKLTIRYYFYYCLTNDQGLDFQDFITFFHLLG